MNCELINQNKTWQEEVMIQESGYYFLLVQLYLLNV